VVVSCCILTDFFCLATLTRLIGCQYDSLPVGVGKNGCKERGLYAMSCFSQDRCPSSFAFKP